MNSDPERRKADAETGDTEAGDVRGTEAPPSRERLPDARADGRIVTLSIAPETVCFLIGRLREYDALDMAPEPAEEASPLDEEDIDEVQDRGNAYKADPLYQELATFIGDLSVDEKVDLVTLMWLGRDSLSVADWPELHREAEDARNARTLSYLLGSSMAADYLQEGLAALGFSCEDSAEERI